ncbi:hypothetical protein [Humibacillus xanthopallidus]|uniref:Uncharacterized protein n=1 Tax=Humibacillus xanthopallidus TaxID=412689 RepID=A0A543HX48_9MICO|nr:hypothetical protein [Humibacillus xanthopallidus]TQM62943.1 hypothetical protein FBY41_2988 [Humibacillus xanthopallidus]
MRRRHPAAELPEPLRVFVREDWPGRDDAEAYGAFIDARHIWRDERGLDFLPDDPEVWAAFPDGEFRVEDI